MKPQKQAERVQISGSIAYVFVYRHPYKMCRPQ